jgi:2-methylcitrate dehydratase PrpD
VLEDADGGYLRAFSDGAHPEALSDALGSAWQLTATCFKPCACCGSLHAHVDAAIDLRTRHGGPPPPQRRVRAGLARVVAVQCGADYRPGTELHAQMNARYCIATALLEGAVLPPQFAGSRLAAREVVALAERIELVHDEALDEIYPAHYAGWVELETTTPGRFERAFVTDPSGSSANPRREEALRAKFRRLAGERSSAAQVSDLEAVLEQPERPVADLVALLADRGGRTRAGGAPLGTPDSAQLEGETGERSLA